MVNISIENETVYTMSSQAQTPWQGKEVILRGSFSGRDIGEIGKISADGKLTLRLPKKVPDDKLDSMPGTETRGAALTISPVVVLNKGTEFLAFVYVSTDFGDYKAGWNYANTRHEAVDSAEGFRWVIVDQHQ